MKESNQKVFRRSDLAAWDLLQRPIWVFDCRKNTMWWANQAGLELWNAKSQDEFLGRDYASDMSESVKLRCREVMRRVENGELFNEQWTYYPRGEATTARVGHSGIMIDQENGEQPYLAMVNECFATQSMNDEVAAEGLRSIEILRHLPEPVAQFDSNGSVITQNPEAFDLFGDASFLDRFVDREVGRDLLATVLDNGVPVNTQVQQQTLQQGPRWFDVQVLSRRDPVTANSAVLYSARDITAIMETEAKSELLSVIAHEIRTPLHQLNGFTELLALTDLNQQQQEYEAMIKYSCVSMMSVINDVLDFGRVESGKLALESIPFDLQSIAKGTISAVTPSGEKKGLKVDFHFDENMPDRVLGDPSRFRQILSNLLNNAIKFTERGGVSVSMISTEHKDGRVMVEVSVQDTGIGISPEGQAIIFQKYRQASGSVSREYGGTGLGLAICKRLVELMKGSIGVESVEKEGSKFWFRIPFTLLKRPSHSSPAPEKRAILRNELSWNILVAEDNRVCQKLADSMLRKLGHSATIVSDGVLAVAAVFDPTNTFDLVLMDVQMPNLDGMGATEQIRQKISASQLPVVGLTADFLPSEMSKYAEVGMNTCLGKPILLDSLRKCIHELQSSASAENTEFERHRLPNS